MQTTANKPDLGKAAQSKNDQLRSGYIRTTETGQYGSHQTSTHRNDQTDKTKADQSAETAQTMRYHTRKTTSQNADQNTGEQARPITTDQTSYHLGARKHVRNGMKKVMNLEKQHKHTRNPYN